MGDGMKQFKKIGSVIPHDETPSAYRIYDVCGNSLNNGRDAERAELARELKIRWNLYEELLAEVRLFYRAEHYQQTGDLLRKIRRIRRKQ